MEIFCFNSFGEERGDPIKNVRRTEDRQKPEHFWQHGRTLFNQFCRECVRAAVTRSVVESVVLQSEDCGFDLNFDHLFVWMMVFIIIFSLLHFFRVTSQNAFLLFNC